ncbi:MAG: ATP-binding protein [Humibacillus sp.]|nr:ATP-binding protein [Humibacillus sp.]MDN5780167.1 ATP-binding protein [Humibacillus sp.]
MFTAEGQFKQTRTARDRVLTPVAYFDVDEMGRPMVDSLALSALTEFTFDLWQRTGGAEADDAALQAALDYSDLRAEQISETFTELTSLDGEPLTPLESTRKLAAALLGPAHHVLAWTTPAGELRTPRTFYHGVWVRSGQDRPPDLLSSFYVTDIEKAMTVSSFSPPLQAYLGAVDVLGERTEQPTPAGAGDGSPGGRRLDVSLRQNLEPLLDLQALPRAAWPSGHALRLSQQVAVTVALDDANRVPVLSVNGPPGTGKTTLLRDLYANVVVQRARALATFDNPRQAVTDPVDTYARTGDKEFRLRIGALDSRLTGFEMVVASSNNAAVENVSAALPGLDALAPAWQGHGYFRGPAEMVATKWAELPDPQGRPRRRVEPWGLSAAILGRRSHLSAFAQGLGLYESRTTVGTGSMREVLSVGASLSAWTDARSAFEQASEAVEAALRARGLAALRVRELDQVRVMVQRSRTELSSLQEQRPGAAELARQNGQAAVDARESNANAAAAMEQWQTNRPGWWARLRKTPAVAQWSARDAALRDAARAAAVGYADAQGAADAAHEQLEAVTRGADAATARLRELETREAELQRAVTEEHLRFPALVTESWWSREESEEIELGSAWVDAEVQQLRERLFLAAMTLHETFARVLGDHTLTALRVWKALVLGELRPADRAKVAVRAWQWLFMVVPLISTTFASLARMLGDIDGPQLGWVIVDEAGQATPHSAVGALMRFSRAVIVGDPDQLEPVVTLPETLLDRVILHRGAAPQSSPSRCSVQLLADAANPFGRNRRGRWVGLPLRVHNRCLDPMFSIANEIAYDNDMVQGRTRGPAVVPGPMGESRWVDVPLVAGSHWSDGSAVAVRALLERLRPVASDPDMFVSVALLSPFREVVEQLRGLREEFLGSLGLDPNALGKAGQDATARMLGPAWEGLDESPTDRLEVGTVHTFQGREKSAVVFVLGGGSNGARRWVADTPNLINVAVTRARDRLYVVGDWDAWTVGHAATMQSHLRRCSV